jgi:hypothetical protein
MAFQGSKETQGFRHDVFDELDVDKLVLKPIPPVTVTSPATVTCDCTVPGKVHGIK